MLESVCVQEVEDGRIAAILSSLFVKRPLLPYDGRDVPGAKEVMSSVQDFRLAALDVDLQNHPAPPQLRVIQQQPVDGSDAHVEGG